MYIPHRIPGPTFRVMLILTDYVCKHKRPIGLRALATLCNTTCLALIAIVKRIGRDGVALRTPFLDAWVVNDETGRPNEKFLIQKIELGYTDDGVDFDEFCRVERERFFH